MNYTFANRIGNLKPSAIREILKFTSQPEIIPFAAGNPSPEAFPVDTIARLTADILQNNPVAALQYSITEGYGPLIDCISGYCRDILGICREADGVIVTSGAQQVMSLATKALCNEGDTIICEAPSFIGSLNAFKSLGINLCGIDVQPDGMDIEQLEQALKTEKNARFIYTIPNFQNPSGVTMSVEKRRALYDLALRYNVMIVEDNPYGDLRFAGTHIPAIKSFDTEGIVIYAGSFSKILAPGMRVGFACAPKEVLSKMVVCKQVDDVHTNILAQMIALGFMQSPEFDSHIEKIQAIYREKANHMMDLLDECQNLEYNRVEGGLFIWCRLADKIDMAEFVKKALGEKVAVVPGIAFLIDENTPCSHIRLNFSTPSYEQITDGMVVLKSLLASY